MSSKTKTYKCPYCDIRSNRTGLVEHIEKEHEELIPEGYSAGRVVFNIVNKKSNGSCVICKKETEWNEKTWRYERFCSSKCKDLAAKQAKDNMLKVHGIPKFTDNIDNQKEMLKHRSISGIYKFSTGGYADYVGSYEKKCFEFMDIVLGIKRSQLMIPGPTLEYKVDGISRLYIPDVYYTSANLIIEIKDGGSNPNTRNMEETRKKQYAKEEQIIKDNVYNYIRLTDNNFEQLLAVLADIKINMDDKKVIHINETSLIAIPYTSSCTDRIEGVGISNNIMSDNMIILNTENQLEKVDIKKFLENRKFDIYDIPKNKSKKIVHELYHNKPDIFNEIYFNNYEEIYTNYIRRNNSFSEDTYNEILSYKKEELSVNKIDILDTSLLSESVNLLGEIEGVTSYINRLDIDYNIDYISENLDDLNNKTNIDNYSEYLIENSTNIFYSEINTVHEINNRLSLEEYNIVKDINNCNVISETDGGKTFIYDGRINNMIDNIQVTTNNKLKPLFIVLIEGNSLASKIIKNSIHSTYTHAAIGFEYNLNILYSFNITSNGFSVENINEYNKNGKLSVYTIFIHEDERSKVLEKIKEFRENKKNKYSFKNAVFNALDIDYNQKNNDMLCTQFVDTMLKSINIDITNKDSYKVRPDDFVSIYKKNKHIYKIFTGICKNYNPKKIKTKLDKMYNNARYINEQYSLPEIKHVLEVKEFPVQFDQDGNLLITNIKQVDFHKEYKASHAILKQYEKNSNIEGMKYEVAKLWYLNQVLENRISDNKYIDVKQSYINVRAFILNDFNKYIKIILKEDKNFIFTEYYNSTPFSDNKYIIKNSTLRYTTSLLKNIL